MALAKQRGVQQFTWNSILFHLVQPSQDQLDDISSLSTLAEYWQVLFNPTILFDILLRAFIEEFLWVCLFAFVYIVKSIHLKNTSIQISLQWNWRLAPLKHMINYLWKTAWYSQDLNTQNGFSVQYILGVDLNRIALAKIFYKKNNAWVQSEQEACYMWRRKPQQTDLSDRGQLMSRYINFMNPQPPRELAATHVLNGSCRQKRMPLCWNKWRGENRVKTTPLRCINLHLFILSFFFSHLSLSSLKKQGVLHVKALFFDKIILNRELILLLHYENYSIYSFFYKTQLPLLLSSP